MQIYINDGKVALNHFRFPIFSLTIPQLHFPAHRAQENTNQKKFNDNKEGVNETEA